MMAAGACSADRGEPEDATGPSAVPPLSESELVGSYEATQLVVQRPASSTDLIGEPDTRISLHLNANGTTQGQLKIGTDPGFRGKVPLEGRWRLSLPSRVAFDFESPTFLGEIAFFIQTPELSGDWVRDTVRIHVTLQKQTLNSPQLFTDAKPPR